VIVVFDSGIWISALHFGGVPMEAIKRGLLEDEVLTCSQIEDETIGIMRKKFQRAETSNRQRLASFLEGATRVTLTAPFSAICRDPKDDFLLECSALGRADILFPATKTSSPSKSSAPPASSLRASTSTSPNRNTRAESNPAPVLN
jgi:predicted nucleic acid-binding protein